MLQPPLTVIATVKPELAVAATVKLEPLTAEAGAAVVTLIVCVDFVAEVMLLICGAAT